MPSQHHAALDAVVAKSLIDAERLGRKLRTEMMVEGARQLIGKPPRHGRYYSAPPLRRDPEGRDALTTALERLRPGLSEAEPDDAIAVCRRIQQSYEAHWWSDPWNSWIAARRAEIALRYCRRFRQPRRHPSMTLRLVDCSIPLGRSA